jgi:ABC-type multidrug transport system fused ATPase/permease subunit
MNILLRINRMAWRYRTRLSFAYFSFFAAVGFSLLIPQLFGESIDALVQFDDGQIIAVDVGRDTLALLALGILGASLMRGLFDFARTYATDSLSQKVSYDIRNGIYDKLQHLSFAYHDKEHTGNLMSKATADVEAVRRYINMGLVRSLDIVIRVIAISFILFFLNWQLALISLVFVPFMIARSTLVMRKLRGMWLHIQEVMGESATILQDNLAGIHVVKAFGAEEYEKKKYDRKAQELREEYFRSERLHGVNSAWMTLYFTLALGLILWYGGWEVVRGDLTAGGLTKFVLYMSQLNFPIRSAAMIINSFARAMSSGRRLFEVLDAKSPVSESINAIDMGRAKGYVRLNNISISYGSNIPALRNVNLSATPGQTIAILGAPGSGKSTIVNLLPRFYDASNGQVTIDDHDIRDFTLASLRRNVGVVQQDVFLFGATIRDNIAYGVADATIEEVVQAAKIAQIHDHVMTLPDGYDTWVSERGTTLSGGQRQRLSIARTILINPPVLILDDSTSSVDVETERLIHGAMAEVMKGRTTFVIAHRLSTVREANLVVVMKNGEIVEQGTHQELFDRGGNYQEIYELQLRPQDEIMLDAIIIGNKGGLN